MSKIFRNFDQALSLARWRLLCRQWGIDDQVAISHEFRRIVTAYSEPHRAYHTAQHINECLDLLDWTAENTSIAPRWCSALELALWYHDVVYQPQASDNERQSADQAISFLQTNNVKSAQIARVESLIMATCHFAGAELSKATELAIWIMDIDLAILGASSQRFLQYNNQIRQEYVWISEMVYRTQRKTLLAQFLGRSVIYQTLLFRERFESQARENLSAIVAAL